MVEVLERRDAASWSEVRECQECESKLKVFAADIAASESMGYPSRLLFHFTCPVCWNKNFVNSDELPPLLRREAIKMMERK